MPLFRRVQQGSASVFVSVVTEAELLVGPKKEGHAEAEQRIQDLLSEDGIYVLDVDRRIGRRAAELRAAFGGFKMPDALIIATALETDCDAVVGNDKNWARVPGLPYVRLDELT